MLLENHWCQTKIYYRLTTLNSIGLYIIAQRNHFKRTRFAHLRQYENKYHFINDSDLVVNITLIYVIKLHLSYHTPVVSKLGP